MFGQKYNFLTKVKLWPLKLRQNNTHCDLVGLFESIENRLFYISHSSDLTKSIFCVVNWVFFRVLPVQSSVDLLWRAFGKNPVWVMMKWENIWRVSFLTMHEEITHFNDCCALIKQFLGTDLDWFLWIILSPGKEELENLIKWSHL